MGRKSLDYSYNYGVFSLNRIREIPHGVQKDGWAQITDEGLTDKQLKIYSTMVELLNLR